MSMQALQAGALSVVEKPVAATHDEYNAMAVRLRTQLAIMSEVKVLRQREPRPSTFPVVSPSRVRQCQAPSALIGVLGIAASTGGPSALLQVLSGLGRDFPLPVVIVQHMTPTFLNGFADWLAGLVPLPVTVVDSPTTLSPGRVYLAPCDDRHLVVRGLTACPA